MIILIYVSINSAFFLFFRHTGEPPLINGWIPFLGEALNFRKNATGLLLSLTKKHGDIFTVHMAGEQHFCFVYSLESFSRLNSSTMEYRSIIQFKGYPSIRPSCRLPTLDDSEQFAFNK